MKESVKEIVRWVVLYILALIAFWVCGTLTMLFFDRVMKLNMENIVYEGFRTGFIAWLLMIVWSLFIKKKK
ncbi:MAG: hypothetical protein J6J42_09080 [Lachnospiraceae bacterium]|nr:hypothetical protein [Lachnospiraceae bacterium]MBP3610473.1 hypothetical protein [Lachnospiraceae bacterium]